MDEDLTRVELDEHHRVLLDAFARADDAIKEWEALRRKAREQLLSFLSVHDADVATKDGVPTLKRTLVQQDRMDTTRFRTEEPALFAAYTNHGSYWMLRRVS